MVITRNRSAISPVTVVILIVLIVAYFIFFHDEQSVIITVAIIVAVLILLCRLLFKNFTDDHPEAVNLLIELVAVVIGVYLAITATNAATESEEKKQVVRIIESVQNDIQLTATNLMWRKQHGIKGDYADNDSLYKYFQLVYGPHQLEPPNMVDYMLNNDLVLKHCPPEALIKLISLNSLMKRLYPLINTSIYPKLELYKRDLETLIREHSHVWGVLNAQKKLLRSETPLDTLLKKLQLDSVYPVNFYRPPKVNSIKLSIDGKPLVVGDLSG